MSRADEGGGGVGRKGGFLAELVKAVLERGMDAELTGQLGYERGNQSSPPDQSGAVLIVTPPDGAVRQAVALSFQSRRCRSRKGSATSARAAGAV